MSSIVDLVADMMAVWPRNNLSQRGVELLVEDLSDIPTSTLGAAVKVLRRTSEFFPTTRAIREAAAEVALVLPTEDEALTQVERRIAWGSREENLRGELTPVHPDVKRAVEHVGGFYAFRTTSEPSIVRGQFLRIYREIRAGRIRAAQISGVAPAIEAA